MNTSPTFKGRTLIYSNRPPTAGSSGGAQAVIEGASPDWWIGPEPIPDNPPPEPEEAPEEESSAKAQEGTIANINNELLLEGQPETNSPPPTQEGGKRPKAWNEMDVDERLTLKSYGTKKGYAVKTFPTPQSWEEQQYKTISNEVLWPIAHSMQPTTGKTVEELEAAYYEGYIPHNELANVALRHMAEKERLTAEDRIWVHDYQCDNVPGALYSRHIPWPSVDFLETVSFPNKEGAAVPLLQTHFFRDFMELTGNRALSTFQRPVDQANFIMTAALVAGMTASISSPIPEDKELKDDAKEILFMAESHPLGQEEYFSIESCHPALQNMAEDVRDPAKREDIRKALLEEISIGSVTKLRIFGTNSSVMNAPVGQVTEEIHQSAADNENALDNTSFKSDGQGNFNIFNASLGNGETANLTACAPQDFDERRPPLISDLVKPIRGRDWIFSVHRNDYTKGTMAKLEAADKLLETNPNATFLFVLQPTREGVAGYDAYAESVFRKAAELREKYDEKSIVIIPEAVKHDDILGLHRQPEMRAFMGLGSRDGHDLTVREAVDANDSRPLGILTSTGIGASDVLGDKDKGAFLIRAPETGETEVDPQEVADALRTILAPENKAKLTERFDFMKERSRQYAAANFSRQIDKAYAPAMAHRFGEDWRETFRHPDGAFFDRKGQERDPEAELRQAEANIGDHEGEMRVKRQAAIEENKDRPKYIKDILEGKTGQSQEEKPSQNVQR